MARVGGGAADPTLKRQEQDQAQQQAKQDAESQKKAATEARNKAQAAQQKLATASAQVKQAQAAAAKAQQAAQQKPAPANATQRLAETATALSIAKSNEFAAKQAAVKMANLATELSIAANTAARAEKKPVPFPTPTVLGAELQADGFKADQRAVPLATGDAQSQFDALSADAKKAAAAAGIKDGAGLSAFGHRLARESMGGAPRQSEVPLSLLSDKSSLEGVKTLVQAAAQAINTPMTPTLASEKFATAIATGMPAPQALVEAKAEEAKGDALTKIATTLTLTKEQLEALPDELKAKLGGVATALEAGHVDEAVSQFKELLAAYAQTPQFRELAATVAKTLAAKLPEGLVKTVLNDEALVKKLLEPQNATLFAQVFSDPAAALPALLKNKDLRDAAIDALVTDPKLSAQLQALGLTAADLKQAGDAAGSLIEAAQALAATPPNTAAAFDAFKRAAHQSKELVARALHAYGEKLPDGALKRLLTSPSFALALTDPSVLDSAAKLLNPQTALAGARELLANRSVRDAAIDALANDETIKKALAAVGLTPKDLKQAGDAAPALFDAITALGKEPADWKGALDALRRAGAAGEPLLKKMGGALYAKLPEDVRKNLTALGITPERFSQLGAALPEVLKAAEAVGRADLQGAVAALLAAAGKAPDVARDALKTLAASMPQGPLKALLSSKAFVDQLITSPATQQSLAKLFSSSTAAEGTRELLANEKLRGAVIDALASEPSTKALLDKLHLTAKDLKDAGGAAVHLFDAAQALGRGDEKGALEALSRAGKIAAPLVRKALAGLAESLPAGPLKDLLGNPDFLAAATDGKTLTALTKLLDPATAQDGLRELLANPKLRNSAIDVAMKQDALKRVVEKLGLTADDLKKAGAAAPALFDAATALARGDRAAAFTALKKALGAAPDVFQKALLGFAKQLPPGLAQDLLSNPQFAEALSKPETLDSLSKLFDDSTRAEGARELLANQTLRDGVIDGIFKDPKLSAALKQRLGLTADDVKQAGDAAVHLFDAAQALTAGDWKTAVEAFGLAKDASAELLQKAGEHLFASLPEPMQKTLREAGLGPENFGQLADAAPHVIAALEKLATRPLTAEATKAAMTELLEAAHLAPDAVAALIAKAAEGLPDGPAKTLLRNQELLKSLLSDAHIDQLKQLIADPAKGAQAILGDKTLRDEVIRAIAKDPKTAAQLEKLGLTVDDLVTAGDAGFSLLTAAQALAETPPNTVAAFEAFKAAMGTAQPLVAKALAKLGEQATDPTLKKLLTSPEFAASITDPATLDSIAKLFDAKTALEGARELLANEKLRDVVLQAIAENPGVKAALAQLDLTTQDLLDAGAAAPHLLDAVAALQKNDWQAAADALGKAGSASAAVLQKIATALFNKLPADLQKTLRDNGVGPENFGELGEAVPHVLRALQLLGGTPTPEQVKGALEELLLAASKAPTVATKLISALASKLPEGVGKTLLSDEALLKTLLEGGNVEQLQQLIDDPLRGAQALLENKSVRDTAIKALAKDAKIAEQLRKLGLSEADLLSAGDAGVELLKAAQSLAAGDTKAAFTHFKAALAGGQALVAKALTNLGQHTADPSLKKLLTDPNFASALTRPEVLDSLAKLVDPATALEGARELLADEQLRTSVLGALAENETVKRALNALNLSADDLVKAGAAAPYLLDAATAVAKNDWQGAADALGKAGAASKELLGKVSQALFTKLPPNLQKWLTEAGFKPEQLAELGAALPKILSGLKAIAEGKVTAEQLKQLFADLITGSEQSRELVAKLLSKAADSLPAGLAKTLLQDQELVKKLLEPGTVAQLQLLLSDPAKGVQALLENKGLRDDVLRAIARDPKIKAKLDALGLTADDLVGAGDAGVSVLKAVQALMEQPPNTQAALAHFKDAAGAAQPLVAKALQAWGQSLPDGALKSLLTNPEFAKLITNPKVLDSVAKLLNPKTTLEGAKELLSDPSLRAVAADAIMASEAGKKLAELGITRDDLVAAGDAAVHLLDAAVAAGNNDWAAVADALKQAGTASKELLVKLTKALFAKLPANVRNTLTAAGLTPDNIDQLVDAVPHLFGAAAALTKHAPPTKDDLRAALGELFEAAKKAPDVAASLLASAAANLPEGVAKALLTNKALLEKLLKDGGVQGSLAKLLSGDLPSISEGIRELSDNSGLRGAIGEALWADPKVRASLEKIGFTSAQDVADAGHAIADAMRLAEHLSSSQFGDAIKDLGSLFAALPEGLKARIAEKASATLKLPPGLADLLLQGTEVLQDQKVWDQFAEAVDAFKRGDAAGFVKELAQMGEYLCTTHPKAAEAFLNALGNLPGGVGRLFKDKELNAALVQTGSLKKVFEAVELMTAGDFGAATSALMDAFGAIAHAGTPFEILGNELPLGDKGVELLGRLFARFVDALPEKVKHKVEMAIAKLVAKAGGSLIPGASWLVAAWEAPELYDEFQKDPKDWTAITIKLAKLGIDIANVIPSMAAYTGTLRTVLGTVETLRDLKLMIDNFQEFQQGFALG